MSDEDNGEEFLFTGTERGGLAFLEVHPGCHLRARDICAVTVGGWGENGEPVYGETVFAHMVNGYVAAFEPSAGCDEAQERARSLVAALAKAGAWRGGGCGPHCNAYVGVPCCSCTSCHGRPA